MRVALQLAVLPVVILFQSVGELRAERALKTTPGRFLGLGWGDGYHAPPCYPGGQAGPGLIPWFQPGASDCKGCDAVGATWEPSAMPYGGPSDFLQESSPSDLPNAPQPLPAPPAPEVPADEPPSAWSPSPSQPQYSVLRPSIVAERPVEDAVIVERSAMPHPQRLSEVEGESQWQQLPIVLQQPEIRRLPKVVLEESLSVAESAAPPVVIQRLPPVLKETVEEPPSELIRRLPPVPAPTVRRLPEVLNTATLGRPQNLR